MCDARIGYRALLNLLPEITAHAAVIANYACVVDRRRTEVQLVLHLRTRCPVVISAAYLEGTALAIHWAAREHGAIPTIADVHQNVHVTIAVGVHNMWVAENVRRAAFGVDTPTNFAGSSVKDE